MPIRFNARFLIAPADAARGAIRGSGELEELRFFTLDDTARHKLAAITDLDKREILIFAPLIVSTLVLGVQPGLIFDVTQSSVDALAAAYQAAIR